MPVVQTAETAASNPAQWEFKSPPAYQFYALSSEAERRSHAPKVEISKFSARTKASLAQLAERGPDMAEVAGSCPAGRTSLRAKALRLGKPALVREACRVEARLVRRSSKSEGGRAKTDRQQSARQATSRTTFSSAAERSPDKREARGAAPRRWTDSDDVAERIRQAAATRSTQVRLLPSSPCSISQRASDQLP